MRKYLLILIAAVSFQSLYSQKDYDKNVRREIDSLKKVLPSLRGTDKVDCLNRLVSKYFDGSIGSWQAEADSASPFAKQANEEAKRIGYKKGLGYSYVNLEAIDCMIYGAFAQGQKKFDKALFNSANDNASKAISIGEELKDYEMLGEAYFILNWLLSEARDNRNLAQRIDYVQKAIECFGKTENKDMLARSYENLYYLTDNNLDVGAEAMKKAIMIYREVGNDRESLVCTNLAENYLLKGDFENAFIYCKRSIEIAEEKKWIEYAAGHAFSLMSGLYVAAGDYETALYYARRAHDYYPPDNFFMSVWSSHIGNLYRLMGNYDSALNYLTPFATMNEWTGRLVEGKVWLSSLYISMNQPEKAMPLINEIIRKTKDEIEQTNDRFAITRLGRIYVNAANIYIQKKDYKNALNYASEGLPLLEYDKRKVLIKDSYQQLAEIFHNMGRNDSAYSYLKKHTILKDSLLSRQFYFRLNSYRKQLEEERKTSQINLLNKDNQLKEQKLQQEAVIKKSLIAGLILLSLLALFIFRTLTLKRKNALQKQRLENEREQAGLQQKAIELEMQALRAQMNPHFIFNCLSSINCFIFKNDNKLASDYLTRFSRLIRMVLMNSSKKLITLEDELEMLRLYLDLERLRFKDAFDYSITTTNIVDAGAIFIPPLLLQPFCENAVWHGLMNKETKGHLNLIISEIVNENYKVLHCLIEDDGVGRQKASVLKSKSAELGKSMGLRITKERLALLNQENNFSTFYKIEDVLNENGGVGGTRVQLKIRYKESIEEMAHLV